MTEFDTEYLREIDSAREDSAYEAWRNLQEKDADGFVIGDPDASDDEWEVDFDDEPWDATPYVLEDDPWEYGFENDGYGW